ncbi:trypsin-like peptidase domain-containing protein [Tautonia sp. JC769]|uniref:trypsin-like peptidase domain-containing protein n=1 Tax=Tautonia sp. JC769 TaxID=3232135 RepID=UPI00345800F6
MRRADDIRPTRMAGRVAIPAVLVGLSVLLVCPGLRAQDAPDRVAPATGLRVAAARALAGVVAVSARNPAGLVVPEGVLPAVPGGSGVVIDGDRGLILTANSVVQQAIDLAGGPLRVTLPDGRSRPVLDFRQDPASDLALLAIDPTGLDLRALDWGDSDAMAPGDLVLSVSHPWGFSGSVSLGVVSGVQRSPASTGLRDLIQTDALIAPGSAGGALVDPEGRLVGILLVVPGLSDRPDRLGFAVPGHRARRIAQELADRGEVRRMVLGVQVSGLDPDRAALLEAGGAVRVDRVIGDGPADRAGLVPGDLILGVDGRRVAAPSDLISAVEFAAADRPMSLEVLRDGQAISMNVRPEPLPDPLGPRPGPLVGTGPPPDDRNPTPDEDPGPVVRLPEPATARDPTRFPGLGLRLGEPSSALIERFELEPTVPGVIIVGVTPGGPADLGGLEPGMVITDVLDRRVRSLADFRQSVAVVPPGRDLILRIQHRGRSEFRVILRDLNSGPNDEGAFAPSPD